MNHIPGDVTVQIFSGGFPGELIPFEAVRQKLNAVLPRLPVSKVIMGWSPDKSLYEKTASFLAERDIGFFLWFPVFSETGALKKLAALTDYQGQEIISNGEHVDEDFAFCCPNNGHNIEKILDIFNQNFASIPFTGVFLDKIRYPSFANGEGVGQGLRSVFSCFCPECLKFYEKENFDIDRFKTALAKPVSLPLGINAYHGSGTYTFDDPIIDDFFKHKAGILFKSLSYICQFFRGKGLGIGFDVFAPFVSPFVGQSLKDLSSLCDFIKPMMYRAANAPAGMPFEAEVMLRETGTEPLHRQNFYKLLGVHPDKKPFDLTFSVKEIKDLCASSACPVYAGMEINRKKDIAEIYPDYIEETIKAYSDTGIQGYALSWNLLDAPEENIAKAAELIHPKTL